MICDSCNVDSHALRLVPGAGFLCSNCRIPVARDPKRERIHVSVFKPRWMEHLGPEPVYIESKRQLIDECSRRGLRAAAVWDKTDRDYGDQMYER